MKSWSMDMLTAVPKNVCDEHTPNYMINLDGTRQVELTWMSFGFLKSWISKYLWKHCYEKKKKKAKSIDALLKVEQGWWLKGEKKPLVLH